MRRIVIRGQLRAQEAWDRIWRPWQRFWFEPANPLPLGVMRILIGGMLLYTHAVWGLNLAGFFGPHGWQSASLVRLLQQDQFAWSFWWWVPEALYGTVFAITLVILLLNMLGAWTPVTSVLAYVITVSNAYRAPIANYGLDQIIGIAALYLAIGPSGQTLSLDRLWQRFRIARRQVSSGVAPEIPPVQPSARANFSIRLLQVHLCVIYVFACLSKLQGESWWNGLAIWQAVSNLEYQSRDLTWLAWYPWLINLLTHATILWEMTFWALVWRPFFRPFVLAIGVAIHLGIGAFMGMWTFGLAVIFAYVSFVPPKTISNVLTILAAAPLKRFQKTRFAEAPAPNPRLEALFWALGLRGSDLDMEAPVPALPTVVTITTWASASTPVLEPAVPASRPVSKPVSRESAPAVVVVEGRLKRQTQIQEYLMKHGFRCYVAGDLHQARSLLAVSEIDALIVISHWFSDAEIIGFREALVSGGAAMPASVFLLGLPRKKLADEFRSHDRHRIIHGSVSLRNLRLIVLDMLGLPEDVAGTRSREIEKQTKSHSSNGHEPRKNGSSAPTELEELPASQNGKER